ncbi:MAG: hypothetical protein V1681_03975 [Candidatus Neomarinimicrobiota bacterium]
MKLFQKNYRLLDFTIFVSTNSRDLVEILDENFLYPEMQAAPPARGWFRLDIEVVNNLEHVRELSDEFHYTYSREQEALLLSYLDGAIRVEISYPGRKISAKVEKIALHYRAALGNWLLTIPFAELVKEYHYYFMHSAALVKNERTLLLAGKSGRGKTTLALALLKRGWQYISDDEVYLYNDQGIYARGGPVRAKVTCKTWEMFSDILGVPDKFRGKRLIDLEAAFPEKVLTIGKVAALCVIKPADELRLDPLKPIDVLKELFSLAFLNSNPEYTSENFDFLANFSHLIPCYKLAFTTDFEELDRRLSEIILTT